MVAKKILFVTGTRADFGKLEPLSKALSDAGFEVGFFVTGMHMLEKYGLTKLEVHRLKGMFIHEFLNQRLNDSLDIVLAKTVLGFSDYVNELKPDLVVVHGDRIEALACAIVCATNYIRCAHVEGGEVSGTIDEIFRHCNTKLACYHFVASDLARDRILRLGESEKSVFSIGSPELDFHAGDSGVSLVKVMERYEISFDAYGICVFHPVTSELSDMREQAKALFSSLEKSKKNYVVIMPNNDPGSDVILEELSNLDCRRCRVLPSMRFSHFSELLKSAALIIGNSSAGVREAPFLGVPSINIGTRQNLRSNANSITTINPKDERAVCLAIVKNWGRRFTPDKSFGSGNAAKQFVKILKATEFWSVSLQKTFK